MDMLGQIGGESHLIILNEKGVNNGNVEQYLQNEFETLQISKAGTKIVSWDYEA